MSKLAFRARAMRSMLLAALFLTACGDSTTDPTDDGPRVVEGVLATATLQPLQVAQLQTQEPVFGGVGEVQGSFAGVPVSMHRIDDRTVGFILPAEVPGGQQTLSIPLSDDVEVRSEAFVSAPPQIADPQATGDTLLGGVDAMIASVEAEADSTGAGMLRHVAQQLTAWSDTASAESKEGLALFIAANPLLFSAYDPGGMPGPSLVSSSVLDCVSTNRTGEQNFLWCKAYLAASVIVFAGGSYAAWVACRTPSSVSNLCLGAIVGIVGGAYMTNRTAKRLRALPELVMGDLLGRFVALVSAPPLTSAASPTDTLRSGETYQLGAVADFRSIVATDADRGGDVATAVGLIDRADQLWNELRAGFDALPSAVRMFAPSLPAGPGATPSQPIATARRAVDGAALSVSGVTNGVAVEFDAATGAFRAETSTSTDFAFDLTYADALSSTVATIQAHVEIAPDGTHQMIVLPGVHFDRTSAVDVNASGQIVGTEIDDAGTTQNVLVWTDGVPAVVPTPGEWFHPKGISDTGEILGVYYDSGSATWHHVVIRNGSPQPLSAPDGYSIYNVDAITPSGDVWGTVEADYQITVVRWDGNGAATLVGPAGTNMVNAANDAGQAAGMVNESRPQAALYSISGGRTLLPDLGVRSIALGLSPTGMAAGQVVDDGGCYFAVIWGANGMEILPRLDPACSTNGATEAAWSVNSHGHVVGMTRSASGATVPTLWMDGAAYVLVELVVDMMGASTLFTPTRIEDDGSILSGAVVDGQPRAVLIRPL